MNSRALVLASLLPLVACFDPVPPGGTGAETGGTGDGDSGDGDGDGDSGDGDGDGDSGDGDGDSGDGDGDGDSGEDRTPPSIQSFTVDGSAMPAKLLQSKVIELAVVASDEVGVTEVELFEGDVSLGLANADPLDDTSFTLPDIISGEATNGTNSYTVVVRDGAGNSAEAGPVELEIEVPAAGTVVWETTEVKSSDDDVINDCMINAAGELVVGGSIGTQGVVTFFNANTGTETEEFSLGGPGEDWAVWQVEAGPNGESLVVGHQQTVPEKTIGVARYNDAGMLLWDTGPLRMGGTFGPFIGAMTVTEDLVFLSKDRFNGTSELIVLDVQTGDEVCASVLDGVSSVGHLVVLEDQDVIAVGTEGVAAPTIGRVARFTSDCSEIWTSTTDASGYGGAWATDSGTILAAGSATVDAPEGPFDGILRELSTDGSQGPATTFDRVNGRDIWRGVAQTPAGDIVLVGESGDDDNLFGGNFFVRAENPPGQLAWQISPINGSADNYDTASAVCLDGAGNTFVVGHLSQTNSGRDWHIVRYAP